MNDRIVVEMGAAAAAFGTESVYARFYARARHVERLARAFGARD